MPARPAPSVRVDATLSTEGALEEVANSEPVAVVLAPSERQAYAGRGSQGVFRGRRVPFRGAFRGGRGRGRFVNPNKSWVRTDTVSDGDSTKQSG